MPLLKLTLFIVALVAVLGHVVLWVVAYHHVSGIEKWSRQAAALISPWWLFDKTLLPAAHDHLRVKALWFFATYAVAGAILWYVW